MPESTRTYLPAAGHHWSLPLYDPIVKLLGGDKARRVLIDQAAIEAGVPTGRDFRLVGWKAGHRVLDIMLPQARGPRHARFWRAGVEAGAEPTGVPGARGWACGFRALGQGGGATIKTIFFILVCDRPAVLRTLWSVDAARN